MANLLVVEDDYNTNEAICEYMKMVGHSTLSAFDGEQAATIIGEQPLFDLVLLDVMLPKTDGFELIQYINTYEIPTIFLTAKVNVEDKVKGLKLGAEDYVTKPFEIAELLARVERVLRRYNKTVKQICFRDLQIDLDARTVTKNNEPIALTAKEFDLLELLVTNPNKVYSRESLLKLVWGDKYPGDVRTVDVHVRRLREKIEANPSEPKYVHTKWGVGYYYQG